MEDLFSFPHFQSVFRSEVSIFIYMYIGLVLESIQLLCLDRSILSVYLLSFCCFQVVSVALFYFFFFCFLPLILRTILFFCLDSFLFYLLQDFEIVLPLVYTHTQSTGAQRVGHALATEQKYTHTHTHTIISI